MVVRICMSTWAEVPDATVLHDDHDFDLITEVTGQPTQWIVSRGTGGRGASIVGVTHPA